MVFAKRIDNNQNEIVEVFRKLGCTVQILSNIGKGCPDILVGINGSNYLFEIKDGTKCASQQKLTELEKKFFDTWKGQVFLINSVNCVLEFINQVRKG